MQIEEQNEEMQEPTAMPEPENNPVPEAETGQHKRLNLERIHTAAARVRHEISKVIIGQHDLLDLLLAAIFSGGHVLVEGVPGIAKTLTSKLLAQTLDVDFSRIQFTPDLMPSDVVGTTVFNMRNSDFTFNPGPVFSNIVLIDEINRAPAKTQAALFEVMEEYQVTVDGKTHIMGFPFFVIATQNPIEQEGTYKLPEAQLDRFLIKINLEYPGLEDEKQILRRFHNDFKVNQRHDVKAVLSTDDIRACQTLVEQIHIREELLDYIAAIVHSTRDHSDLFLGASPRASLAMMKMAKAIAAMNGRDFVTPDDIRYVSFPVLNHRIILTPEREMEGYEVREVVDSIVGKIEVPR